MQIQSRAFCIYKLKFIDCKTLTCFATFEIEYTLCISTVFGTYLIIISASTWQAIDHLVVIGNFINKTFVLEPHLTINNVSLKKVTPIDENILVYFITYIVINSYRSSWRFTFNIARNKLKIECITLDFNYRTLTLFHNVYSRI